MSLFETFQRRIEETRTGGEQPVIIFDLDDTLIDCRHRKHRVIHDFIKQSHVKESFALECQLVERMSWENVQYRVLDTLAQEGIRNQLFGEQLFNFWRQNYFTYPYLVDDKPFPGALEFVRHCHDLGATLVYLTGRDIPGMGQGTFEAMRRMGFPSDDARVHYILKEDPDINDLEFKVLALNKVEPLGRVIAAFENELPNLHAMAERFPDAAMYWRKTLYMPNPPEPLPHIQVLLHFKET
ncbi:HAD family hydrolase [Oligoflexus tunisiensis]|uniref:HAD family hydrolase n=1 Tax=Oligoflexus tunisiensis TaxID=708132 RepID=UPI000A689055|nr:HAD family hydrolase [Oligoflexus tunisiensis]